MANLHGTDLERLGRLLRLLPPAPESWVALARGLMPGAAQPDDRPVGERVTAAASSRLEDAGSRRGQP